MKKINLGIGIVMVLLLAGCSGIKITSDSNNSDLTRYKTYKIVHFMNEEDLAAKQFPINELNKNRLLAALKTQAELKGLQESDDPDMLLLWSVNSDMSRSYSTHTNYNGGAYMGYRGRGYGGYGGGMSSSYSTTQENITIIGFLNIAVIDAETEELQWLGTAEKEVNSKQKNAEEMINKIVGKVFETYPVDVQ